MPERLIKRDFNSTPAPFSLKKEGVKNLSFCKGKGRDRVRGNIGGSDG